MSLRLDWCSHEAAKYAVEKWHYSKTVPVGKTAKVGVWENDKFIGAVIYSCGSAGVGSISRSLGIEPIEVAELARVALSQHNATVTRIVSVSLKLLRRGFPRLRLLVSYADPEQGHVGGIYQGGNWIYTGRSAPDVAYIDRTGKRWHSRSVSETGLKTRHGHATRAPKVSDMVSTVDLEPKYRYMMPLDPAMRAQIEKLAKPYPKREPRAASIDSDAPDVQSGEGGATPTAALHTNLVSER